MTIFNCKQMGCVMVAGLFTASSVCAYSPAPPDVSDAANEIEGMLWNGLNIKATLTTDWSVNLQGGLNTNGSALRHLLDVAITVDTEVMFGIEGGTVGMLFQNQSGPDASVEDTGDLQVFSNIDADGRTQLAELWYEQTLSDEQLRVTIGKIDVNALFAFVDNGAEFIHSSPGFSPTIVGFPSYPDPAMSASIFYQPDGSVYVGVGLFDGALNEGVRTGSRGPGTFFHEPGDLFIIGETGSRWSSADGLEGRIGLGAWHHHGTFARFDGGTEDGTTGFYVVFDQALWQKEGHPGVSMFAQYGYADDSVSEIGHHAGAGLTARGLFANRSDDLLGLMASLAHLSDEAGAGFTENYELAIELFYKAQINESFSLKPDLQYIIHPGGDAALKDALVATLRGEFTF